jgi:oxygen-dependent protoporphyrinogen oxidase
VVLEASPRPGGVIRSATIDGRVLEWGPQRTRLTSAYARLVAALDLEDELLTAPEDLDLFVYKRGALRRVPLTFGELVRSDVVGVVGKLRLLLEPLTGPPRPSERVAACFRRKLGDDLYESLVGPLFGGLYGTDPAEMEVGIALYDTLERLEVRRSLFFALLRRAGGPGPVACSFRNGMQALPEGLARALAHRFRPESPVRALRRSGAGWRVSLEGEELDAEHVVLTVPAPAAAALTRKVAPTLSEALGRLRYNSLALVHLDADAGVRGLGFQVALTEGDTLLRGVTFNNHLFGATRRRVHTAFLGGSRHPEVAEMERSSLAEAAVRAFAEATGQASEPLAAELTRMPAWDTSWRALDGLSVPTGLHLAGSWRSRPGLPGRLAEARSVAAELQPESAA